MSWKLNQNRQIGQLNVELKWLKKNLTLSVDDKRVCIKPEHPEITVCSQCDLLGLPRSSYYYKPEQESEYNLMLMKLIDEQYTRIPFYSSVKDDGMAQKRKT